LPIEAGGKALQERADRLAAENGLLAQKLAGRDSALGDARARIKALEEKLSTAGEGASKLAENDQNELRVAHDRLQKKTG
jgi:predicted nuclease with TOPRIM domain